VGLSFDKKALFIRDDPNDGDDINEVKVGSHLSSLDIGLSKAALTSADTAAGDKKIKRGQDVVVTVKGMDLVGDVILRKGQIMISADLVQVKESNETKHVSDLKEARATFKTSIPASTDFELVIKNAAGTSNAIGGFEIVD
jgi:hypothetical protein